MVMDTHGALPGQVQPGGCAQQRVSHELLDVSFSCAEHAETTLAARGPAQLHCLDDEMYVAGQIDDSATTISEIQRLGIKTVFNIRLANEQGFVDIAPLLEASGVSYAHCPINYGEPNEQDVDRLLGLLDACAKPCLLFCQVGLRAAAMGVTFRTVRRRAAMALNGTLGSSPADFLDLVGQENAQVIDEMSTDAPEDSQLKAFIASYISAKVKNCVNRPGVGKICDQVYLAGQLSEEELREYATSKGCKSVLNLREPKEAGQFGLGMLSKEKEVVEGLGLKYVNVPVPREGEYSVELCKEVSEALQNLLASASPVLVHCRTGGRAKQILTKSMANGLMAESPCQPFAEAAASVVITGSSMGHAAVGAGQLPDMQVSGHLQYPMYPMHPYPQAGLQKVMWLPQGAFPYIAGGIVEETKVLQIRNNGDLEAGPGAAADTPTPHMATVVLASICMGLVFGSVMDLGKVTNPIVIREQMIFQRFIMLKMFLGAAGGSAFFFAILSKITPVRFSAARQAYFPSLTSKGLLATSVGPVLLGAGMALAGSCPGMVLIQCGSGVPSGPVALAGGFAAAIVFGFVQPLLVPAMGVCNIQKAKAEDFKMLSGLPFWVLAMGMCCACFAVIGVFEYFFPWDSAGKQWNQWLWTGELPWFSKPWENTLPPELAGFIVGALQVPAVLACLDTLGSSSAYMTLSSQVLLTATVQEKLPHWSGFRVGLGNWWQAIYIMFAILGAFITSWSTGTFGLAAGVKEWEAFLGGFLMIFGSRIGSGCTSGHGLSGMGMLALKSMVAVPAMFGGGMMVGFIYQAVDPAGYTGFAFPASTLV